MKFDRLLKMAKSGNKKAKEEIYIMYRPCLLKMSVLLGRFDEDLYQELCWVLLVCINKFNIDRVKMRKV